MLSPITGKDMVLQSEVVDIEYREEKFEIVSHYYLCEGSKERFEDEHLIQLNLDQVYSQYKNRKNLQ